MGVGLLEFHQLDRMIQSGRAAARALLEQASGDLGATPHGESEASDKPDEPDEPDEAA